MIKNKLLSFPAGLVLCCSFTVSAAEPADVVTFVESAFDYIEAHGEEGLQQMNEDMQSRWLESELYPFVVDCDSGFALVHVKQPVLGINLVEKLKDKVTGKLFLKEMCDATKNQPDGIWQSYWWSKPQQSTVSKKIAYIVRSKKYPNYIIGSGMYSDSIDVVTLNSNLK